MKTRILSFVTIAAIVLGISSNTFAATKNDSAVKNNEVSTVLTNVSKIDKIEIRGNVELFVTDGSNDQVKVYNRYYSESALVQSQKGVLRITSYSAQKLVVWVTANELSAITAYDDAEVRSFGKLSSIEMDITLHNNAYAKLDMGGYSANITVNDRAKADLTGNVNECNLNYTRSASVNSTNFVADHITRNIDGNSVIKSEGRELVGL
ncbi:MAG: GIN domain-containing protein [Mucilaginibacter sp.]